MAKFSIGITYTVWTDVEAKTEDEAVDKATLRLVSAHNDGFGVDDVGVAMTALVPLPAAVWLMFGALEPYSIF